MTQVLVDAVERVRSFDIIPFLTEVAVHLARIALSLTLITALACKDKDPGGPPGGAASVVAGTAASAGVVGTSLSASPTFTVRNSGGEAIGGIALSVAVTSGGGSLAGAPSQSTAGETSVGVWTLGPTAGAQSVTVTVRGLTPLVLTVTAAPGAATGVTISAGNNQTALAGTAVATAVQARLVDSFGNAIPGQTINWSVMEGSGTLTGSTSTVSNASGIATAPGWTLGRVGGAQRIRANFGAFEAFVTATVQSAYVVDLRWATTPPTGAILDAFTRAVNRIRASVVGGVTSIGFPANFTNVSQCPGGPTGQPDFTESTIPGVIIYASVGPIDGLGRQLGSAGPCLIRPAASQYKPALGLMRFDEVDLPGLVATGRLDAVILHEMLHVIGIGTVWTQNSFLLNGGTADARYTGSRAREACANLNGGTTSCATNVPVHSADGVGSADSHWRESTFTTELMTPFIGSGGAPYAAMTIESLGDFGYTVNLNAADAYTVSAGLYAAPSTLSLDRVPLRLPEPIQPTFTVDDRGRLVPLRKPK